MNRYTQLSFSDYSNAPIPQLPFEQLDAVLSQFQKQKDVTDALAEQDFEHLPNEKDTAFANKIREEINQMRENLTAKAQEGDLGNYLSELKKVQTELLKMRAPGGKIKVLADRLASFQKTNADLKEKLSEAPEKYVNTTLSEIQIPDVENALGGYNTTISGPNVGKYMFLGKEALDAFNGFVADQRGWVKKEGVYVYSGTDRYVSEEDVRNATREFLSQPGYKDQIAREARYTPVNTRTIANRIISEDFGGMSALEMQQKLNSLGYDLEEDGKMGPATNQAMYDYAMSQIKDGRKIEETYEMRYASLIDSYVEPVVEKYAFNQGDKDLKKYSDAAASAAQKKVNPFTSNFVTSGPTVNRRADDVPSANEFLVAKEANDKEIKQLQDKYDRLIAMQKAGTNIPEEKFEEVQAKIDRLEAINYRNQTIYDRAVENLKEELDVSNAGFNFDRIDKGLAIRDINNKDLFKYIYDSTKHILAKGYSEEIEQELKDAVEKMLLNELSDSFKEIVDLKGEDPVNINSRLHLSSAVSTIVKQINKYTPSSPVNKSKIKKEVENILENQTSIQPKALIFNEDASAKRMSSQVVNSLNVSAALIWHGSSGEVVTNQDLRSVLGKNTNKILFGEAFNLVGFVPSGIYGEGNVIVGAIKEGDNAGQQFYISLKGSNLDSMLGKAMMQAEDPSQVVLGNILVKPQLAQLYRDVSSLPKDIPEYISYGGVGYIVNRISDNEYKVSIYGHEEETQIYASPLDASRSIHNSIMSNDQF